MWSNLYQIIYPLDVYYRFLKVVILTIRKSLTANALAVYYHVNYCVLHRIMVPVGLEKWVEDLVMIAQR